VHHFQHAVVLQDRHTRDCAPVCWRPAPGSSRCAAAAASTSTACLHACTITCVHRVQHQVPSHGPPHADGEITELKIAEDGEILIRGELVMKVCAARAMPWHQTSRAVPRLAIRLRLTTRPTPRAPQGYFNQDALSAEVLEPPEPGQSYGWFHTGDIGIGSSCRLKNEATATRRQVRPALAPQPWLLSPGSPPMVTEK
jgi:acyl-CoA synthetase (AMP-forming)/AMP-acid ligase II